MSTEGCFIFQGSMRRVVSSIGFYAGMFGIYAVIYMRLYVYRVVFVTFFLGDLVQLESYIFECFESERQQERRIRGGERIVRQVGGLGRVVGVALGRAEGGGGAGTIFWFWVGCWAWV